MSANDAAEELFERRRNYVKGLMFVAMLLVGTAAVLVVGRP